MASRSWSLGAGVRHIGLSRSRHTPARRLLLRIPGSEVVARRFLYILDSRILQRPGRAPAPSRPAWPGCRGAEAEAIADSSVLQSPLAGEKYRPHAGGTHPDFPIYVAASLDRELSVNVATNTSGFGGREPRLLFGTRTLSCGQRDARRSHVRRPGQATAPCTSRWGRRALVSPSTGPRRVVKRNRLRLSTPASFDPAPG